MFELLKRHKINANSDQMGCLCHSWVCWHIGTGRSLAQNLSKVLASALGRPEIFALLRVGKITYLRAFGIAVSEKAAEVPLKDPKLRTYGNLEDSFLSKVC